MTVITAIEKIDTSLPTVFLAGGITDCPEWQDEIIEILGDRDDLVLLNPRRADFPIDDPNASEEQITWEYHALNDCTVFSMWFSAGSSDQPICMYELGRHLALKTTDKIVIGVEKGYKREQDVYVQVGLIDGNLKDNIAGSLEEHAKNIIKAVSAGDRISRNQKLAGITK